jgi:hypothetical protein
VPLGMTTKSRSLGFARDANSIKHLPERLKGCPFKAPQWLME